MVFCTSQKYSSTSRKIDMRTIGFEPASRLDFQIRILRSTITAICERLHFLCFFTSFVKEELRGQKRPTEDHSDHPGINSQPSLNKINHQINIYGTFVCQSQIPCYSLRPLTLYMTYCLFYIFRATLFLSLFFTFTRNVLYFMNDTMSIIYLL